MNKFILTSLAFLLFINYASGQIKFGAKAGLNFSNARNIGSTENKNKFGINAGLLGKLYIRKRFLIQLESLYSIKGYKFPKTALNGSGFLQFNYISVPLLVGFKFTDKFAALLGPEFNFLTRAKSKFNNTDHDVTKIYRKFDLGIDLGVAYNLNAKLGIELRYFYGFEDLADVTITDSMGNFIRNDRIGSNRVLQFGLYYIFSKR